MKIVLTPDQFLGMDVLIGAFSFIVLFLFSFFALKSYKLNKNRKFLYLGIGFGLIGLAQLATILTKLVLYYDFGPTQAVGRAIIASNTVSSVDIFYYTGFFFYRFLTLAGLYIIYRLPRIKKSAGDYLLAVYFIILSALLSKQFFYLFHLTAFVLLALIINNYYQIYKKNKYFNTKILISAFGILAFAQVLFLLSNIDIMFIIASMIELISYLILLVLIIRILEHGKKKKSNGDNLRHTNLNSES